ncbi:hypothetical protein SBRCBS47491_003382 [Sporothrix bragantina]|uniref:Uncharacterized protein n=1 Tax=Sporothrix bragantina TaxID=671064 RepID=A0ABP0BEZ9_9PEZI
MAILSEIVRFVLPTTRRSDFARLCARLASHSAVRSQYFGPSIAVSLPILQNEMCWMIQWRGARPPELQKLVAELSPDHAATSLILTLDDSQATSLEKALEAPICQFATIRLQDTAPISDPMLQHSMHKTFTDCYLADDGFIDGTWAYASNTNDVSGVSWTKTETTTEVDTRDRKLGIYALGWTSRAAHDAYSKTSLFAEEIDKLQPWFAPGTGAWYVEFEKYDKE